jgi:uncharacterized protein (TIGR00251 family)
MSAPASPPLLSPSPRGTLVNVLASAGSSRSAVRGIHGDALKVAVRAAPEKGKANAEIAALLANFFGVPPKSVTLVSGAASRQKRFEIPLPLAAAQRLIDHAAK